MTTQDQPRSSVVKTVWFDFMGTCLDWHSSITAALPHELSEEERSRFALEWRQAYFDANAVRVNNGDPPEDFDTLLRQTLHSFVKDQANIKHFFSEDVENKAIAAWHSQKAWPDVPGAVKRLRQQGYEVFVHANGTTRLQLDLIRSSGLEFDMLFSSELLGVIKPALESYEKVLKLIRRKPEECVMVAAHAYDTRGAKSCGMKTVYIRRWTDDIREDQEQVRKEHDAYLNDMRELHTAISRL